MNEIEVNVRIDVTRDDHNFLQNYFKEAWNIFDFVTVIGSSADVLFTEFGKGIHDVTVIAFVLLVSLSLLTRLIN